MQLGPLDKSRSIAPDVSQHRGRDAKGNNVSNRIELNTDLGGCLCKSCDTTVEHIEQERKADRDRGIIEVSGGSGEIRSHVVEKLKAAQRLHHRKEPHADIGRGECRRYEIEPFFHTAARRIRTSRFFCMTQEILPMIVVPPRTRSPSLTITRTFAGNRRSVRELNLIIPKRSPRPRL